MVGNKTNNYVRVILKHDALGEESFERLWAKIVPEGYQLDNIPFYAKNYSYRDIVSVENIENKLFVAGLVREQGHSTVRTLIKDVILVQGIRDSFKQMGCTSELSNLPNLVAIDIPAEIKYDEIKQCLDEGESNGQWEYWTSSTMLTMSKVK